MMQNQSLMMISAQCSSVIEWSNWPNPHYDHHFIIHWPWPLSSAPPILHLLVERDNKEITKESILKRSGVGSEEKNYISTVCFTSSCIRNRAVVSMFWHFWEPKGLLCNHKTGRKLLLGQKFTQVALTMCQEGSQKTNKIPVCSW